MMKKIHGVYHAPSPHWVGDGFPVRSLFSYHNYGKQLSPFLLLDYAGPADFTPHHPPRGVGQHPHRGFETVTIVYQGQVAHHDSTGQGGVIGPGDVQWMTAGAGILHEEFHSEAFSQTGGTLEMVQLWVNLPAKNKMAEPGYQAILAQNIPTLNLPDGAGRLRVIAGNYQGHQGPAKTFSPLNVWDAILNAGTKNAWILPEGWNTALVVLHGTVQINGNTLVGEAEWVLMDPGGSRLIVVANTNAVVLLLSGKPIDEPIVGYGPFVMNSQQEITDAIADFNGERFGKMN